MPFCTRSCARPAKLLAPLCGVALAALLAVTAQAADHKVDELKEPKKEDVRNFRPTLQAGQLNNEDLPAFESVVKYQIAEFSQPGNLTKLPKLRAQLKTNLKVASNAPIDGAHKVLRTAVRQGMIRLVGPEYHPFVRVNAMLVLAELNEKEASTNNQEPPKVDLETVKFMIKAAEDPMQLDAVKAAAMMGLDRNARQGIKDDRVIADILKLSLDMTKPANHEWLRRRAVMLIAALGVVGKDAEAPKALEQLMSNPKESLPMRCAAARAFGSLDFTAGPRIAFVPAILKMAQLTVDVLDKTKPKTGWNPQEIFPTEALLRDIEVGLRGRPDPTPSFQERAPDRGMLLVLTGEGDPQRKLLDEFLTTKFAPVAKAVYTFAPGRERELDALATQLQTWAQAHPVETGKPAAEKTAAKEPGKSVGP